MKNRKSSRKRTGPDSVKAAPGVDELATQALRVDEANTTGSEQKHAQSDAVEVTSSVDECVAQTLHVEETNTTGSEQKCAQPDAVEVMPCVDERATQVFHADEANVTDSEHKGVMPDTVEAVPNVNERVAQAPYADEVKAVNRRWKRRRRTGSAKAKKADSEHLRLSSLASEIHALNAAQVVAANERTADQASICVAQQHGDADVSLGQRLMRARVLQGWSQADVAARLRLPIKLIDRLEQDNYAGLTHGMFLRGYLGSYARLVGICAEQAEDVAVAHAETAPLVATGTIPRSRYLFERYSVSATYLVLTAIIVVPVVWLATHGGLGQNFAHTTPLDPPAAEMVTVQTIPASFAPVRYSADLADTATDVSAVEPVVEQAPIVASMTPFSMASSQLPAHRSVAATVGSGAHTLELKLAQQSWVEITTADGRKLESGTLAAGSEHTYLSDGPLSVRIGNTQGAQVLVDGRIVDLTPFQHANVAHIKLFDEAGAPISRLE